MAGYFRKRILSNSNGTTDSTTHDWQTRGPYQLSTANVHSAYIPAPTDIITVETLNYPTNGLNQTSAGSGNISCWVEWTGSVWEINISDLTYTGIVQYRLKNVR